MERVVHLRFLTSRAVQYKTQFGGTLTIHGTAALPSSLLVHYVMLWCGVPITKNHKTVTNDDTFGFWLWALRGKVFQSVSADFRCVYLKLQHWKLAQLLCNHTLPSLRLFCFKAAHSRTSCPVLRGLSTVRVSVRRGAIESLYAWDPSGLDSTAVSNAAWNAQWLHLASAELLTLECFYWVRT